MLVHLDTLKKENGGFLDYDWEPRYTQLGLKEKDFSKETKIKISLKASYTPDDVHVKGVVDCSFIHKCSRCLEQFNYSFSINFTESLPLEHQGMNTSEVLVEKDGYVDLSWFFHDLIMLNLPVKVLCHNDCRGICSRCGTNLNVGKCNCSPDSIDPRLAELQKLLKEV